MNMLNKTFEASSPLLSDEKIEAQVFRDLEATRHANSELEKASFIIFQYPDNRTVFQRLSAWWYLRRQPVMEGQETAPVAPLAEPVWPRHWATTKYL